jgi:integrase/recombinase XerD
MILSPKEVRDIVSSAKNPRDKAYIRLLYETATTPGELLDGEIQDVDLEQETIYVRGNKQHKSQTMELHNEGLHYLREYLKQHPAVDDPFTTTSEEPLWVKTESYQCKNCGEREYLHENEDCDACDSFEPDEIEEIGYRAMNTMFKRCVERAGIDRDIKQKYLRKSMLTRLAPELGYEQLNNFARWVPGSSQAQHYVSLSNDELRSMVRDRFKGGEGEEKELIECKNCGSRNDPERLECKKCHRPLNVAKSKKMERADQIAERLSEFDDEKLDRIEENMELLENPQEFIREQMEELQQD